MVSSFSAALQVCDEFNQNFYIKQVLHVFFSLPPAVVEFSKSVVKYIFCVVFSSLSNRLKSRRLSTSLFQLRQSGPWSARRASTSNNSPTSLELPSRWVYRACVNRALQWRRERKVVKSSLITTELNLHHFFLKLHIERVGIRLAVSAVWVSPTLLTTAEDVSYLWSKTNKKRRWLVSWAFQKAPQAPRLERWGSWSVNSPNII